MTTITLNGQTHEVPEGTTVLEAARLAGVEIPTLCHHEALGSYGACRVCVVEAEGPAMRRGLAAACTLPVSDGLVVMTDSPDVHRTRKVIFELLLGRSPDSESLRAMAKRYGVDFTRFAEGARHDLCVRCGLCVRICKEKIGAAAISFAGRGQSRNVTTEFGALSELCIGCGACAVVCPTGMIRVEDGDGERAIMRQDLTIARFTLLTCTSCCAPVVTDKFLEQRLKALPEGQTEVLCLDCKRQRTAATAENFPNIWS
jgi:NADH dehydrogenase/NADH:ubiquinone oxidoreductase subunit G